MSAWFMTVLQVCVAVILAAFSFRVAALVLSLTFEGTFLDYETWRRKP